MKQKIKTCTQNGQNLIAPFALSHHVLLICKIQYWPITWQAILSSSMRIYFNLLLCFVSLKGHARNYFYFWFYTYFVIDSRCQFLQLARQGQVVHFVDLARSMIGCAARPSSASRYKFFKWFHLKVHIFNNFFTWIGNKFPAFYNKYCMYCACPLCMQFFPFCIYIWLTTFDIRNLNLFQIVALWNKCNNARGVSKRQHFQIYKTLLLDLSNHAALRFFLG